MRTRIADIAQELGVSTATVSNVIHGKTKKISDGTVKRVQELLEERNYIPGMAQILLAQNDSRIVGVVINKHEKYEGHVLEDGFIASSLNFLYQELEEAGYFMMIKLTDDWNEIVRVASMWNMEGLVLIGYCDQDYRRLRESVHIPFVIYDGYTESLERACNLMIDNYDGGCQVGAYLKRMGHRKVLCVADNCICMDKDRMEGCRAAMAGCQVDFLQISFERRDRESFYRGWMEKIAAYTAVFAASDHYAIELLRQFREQGIRVPEDISVVGFDDGPLCENVYPPLTTVRQDPAERARLAVEAMQRMKQGDYGNHTVKLPVRLIERSSVRSLPS